MDLAESISRKIRQIRGTIAVTESLTSGSLSCHLGAAEASSEWFVGGVIGYSSEVKFSVLGVNRGSVITAACALQMATGVAKLTGDRLAVAVTGVGGPGSEENKPAGTVFIAVHSTAGSRFQEHHFEGSPSDVAKQTTLHALQMVETAVAELR